MAVTRKKKAIISAKQASTTSRSRSSAQKASSKLLTSRKRPAPDPTPGDEVDRAPRRPFRIPTPPVDAQAATKPLDQQLEYLITAVISVQRTIRWQGFVCRMRLGSYTSASLEKALKTRLERKLDTSFSILGGTAKIECSHARCKSRYQTLSDISADEWLGVEELIQEINSIYPNYSISVELALQADGALETPRRTGVVVIDPQPAAAQPVDLSSSSLAARTAPAWLAQTSRTTRHTHTTHLKAELAAEPFIEPLTFTIRELVEFWRCTKRACNNYNYICWIDHSQVHFPLRSHALKMWAIAIRNGVASNNSPPRHVKDYITRPPKHPSNVQQLPQRSRCV